MTGTDTVPVFLSAKASPTISPAALARACTKPSPHSELHSGIPLNRKIPCAGSGLTDLADESVR